MFENTSRYARIPTARYVTPDSRTVAYVRRRTVPRGDTMPLLVEVTVTQGERLDLIAARILGDPEQFWRICDANNALNPLDLTGQPGRVIRVTVPQP